MNGLTYTNDLKPYFERWLKENKGKELILYVRGIGVMLDAVTTVEKWIYQIEQTPENKKKTSAICRANKAHLERLYIAIERNLTSPEHLGYKTSTK